MPDWQYLGKFFDKRVQTIMSGTNTTASITGNPKGCQEALSVVILVQSIY